MRLKLRSKLGAVLILIGVVFAGVGVVDLAKKSSVYTSSILDPPKASEDIKAPDQEDQEEEKKPAYSFYKDDDRDGLANAWEEVFGSDPLKQDTDGDDYLDGEEVAKGYDPIVPGEARLEKRKAENLSLDYFLWAMNQGEKDPSVNDQAKIKEFAQDKGLLSLSEVSASELNLSPEDSQQSLEEYLEKLNKIGFPRAAFDYQTLASGYQEEDEVSKAQLEDLIGRVEISLQDLRSLSAPARTHELHKKYVRVFSNFHQFLLDLKKARQDPVRIELNLLKAADLIRIAFEAEELKTEISP